MKTKIKIEETRSPSLTRAVIRQIGDRDNLEDVARHGCDGGFVGFTYYTDTVAFFKKNRVAIINLVNQMAEDLGEPPAEMVAGFNCLGGRQLCRTRDEASDWRVLAKNRAVLAEYLPSVYRCLGGGRLTDDDTQVANALAWFAAEEIARELNPEI